MTKLKITSALLWLAIMTGPALSQDFVDSKIQALFAQGYTHFKVSRGLLQTEIEAYGPNFSKLEVNLSSVDGSVISQRSETENQNEYESNIREISETRDNVREERDDDEGYTSDGDDGDDDHAESHEADKHDRDDDFDDDSDNNSDGADDDDRNDHSDDEQDDDSDDGNDDD